jgi:hypothetical protein
MAWSTKGLLLVHLLLGLVSASLALAGCGASAHVPVVGPGGTRAGTGGGGGRSADASLCADTLAGAATAYRQFLAAYPDPTRIARSVDTTGKVKMVAPGDWTSGFPAGSYWLLYEATGDAAWLAAAKMQTAPLAGVRMADGDMADVGFIINGSFGNGYRLTRDASYRSVLLDGAAFLAARFNAAVGATRSWDFGTWKFPVIVDNMMNLEILFHAADAGGGARFASIGTTHALTTRANHIRADGSSYQLVDFDPNTGAVLSKEKYASLTVDSTWSRGEAWALYGFTMAYRETHDARFLDQAIAIARYWTGSPTMPADGIPYFDFDVPNHREVTPLRDASAGAIAASGLLELGGYASAPDGPAFTAFAVKALRTLSSSAYRAAPGSNGNFLLMHAVGAYTFNVEVDVGTNYADYYYIEALARCARGT